MDVGLPNVIAAVGLTLIEASGGGVKADGQAVKPANIRVRFMKRDAPASCDTAPDSSCLSAPDPEAPADRTVQETFIDRDKNYAEVVRLLIDVVDDKKQPVASFDSGLSLKELPNTVYQADPAMGHRQLFFDARFLGSRITPDGKVDGVRISLVQGKAAVTLRSVATARYRVDTGGVLPGTPYFASLRIEPLPRGPFSTVGVLKPVEAVVLQQWVDEGAYERNRNYPQRTWSYGAPNVAVDWIEGKALDTISEAPAFSLEADEVLTRVDSIRTDMTINATGQVSPARPREITLNPEHRVLRRDTPPFAGEFAFAYDGLQHAMPWQAFFKMTIWHEARHCWQGQLPALNSLIDGDGDSLVLAASQSCQELLDAPHAGRPSNAGGNAEYDFGGISDDDRFERGYAVKSAKERNAVRFAAQSIPKLVECATMDSFQLSAIPTAGGWLLSAYIASGFTGYVVDPLDPDNMIAQATMAGLEGAQVRLEQGTSCASGTGWNLVSYLTGDRAGLVSGKVTQPGTYRFVLLPPMPECGALVVSSCLEVK